MAADVARWLLALMGLGLGVTCGGSLVYAKGWDQRGRFLVLAGYALIITGGQLEALGRAPTWRTWALLVVTAFAVATTGAFLIRHVRRAKGGPNDGRSSRYQRRFLRAGPPAGRAGHARYSAWEKSRGPEA